MSQDMNAFDRDFFGQQGQMSSSMDAFDGDFFGQGQEQGGESAATAGGDFYQQFRSQTEKPENPDDRWEVAKGVSSGIDQTQALGYGLGALAADAIGWEGAKKWAMEGYEQNIQEAEDNAPRVRRVEDIHGVGDATDWAMGTLGQLAPTIATMVGTGVVGGAIGKRMAQGAVRKYLEKQSGRELREGAADRLTAQAVRRGASGGQKAGVFVGGMGMETGEIYGDVAAEGAEGAGAIIPSLAGGALAGALEALPVLRIAKRFGFAGELEDRVLLELSNQSLRRRVAMGAVKQAGVEGATELVQTAIEEATKAYILERGLPEEMGSMLLNAAAAGALGGGVMGGIGGLVAGAAQKATGKDVLEDDSPQRYALGTSAESGELHQAAQPPVGDYAQNPGNLRVGDVPVQTGKVTFDLDGLPAATQADVAAMAADPAIEVGAPDVAEWVDESLQGADTQGNAMAGAFAQARAEQDALRPGWDFNTVTGEVYEYAEPAYEEDAYAGLEAQGDWYLQDLMTEALEAGVSPSDVENQFMALGDAGYSDVATELQRLIDEVKHGQNRAEAGIGAASEVAADVGERAGQSAQPPATPATGQQSANETEPEPPGPVSAGLGLNPLKAPPSSGAFSFKATHQAADGELLMATAEPGVYLDEQGAEVEDANAEALPAVAEPVSRGGDVADVGQAQGGAAVPVPEDGAGAVVEPEAPNRTLTDALSEALEPESGRWQALRESGADNVTLGHALADQFGVKGRRGGDWSASGGRRAALGQGTPSFRFGGKNLVGPDVTAAARAVLGIPEANAEYESRYPGRVKRAEAAETLESAEAVLTEEYADSERHIEGTGRVERAVKDARRRLDPGAERREQVAATSREEALIARIEKAETQGEVDSILREYESKKRKIGPERVRRVAEWRKLNLEVDGWSDSRWLEVLRAVRDNDTKQLKTLLSNNDLRYQVRARGFAVRGIPVRQGLQGFAGLSLNGEEKLKELEQKRRATQNLSESAKETPPESAQERVPEPTVDPGGAAKIGDIIDDGGNRRWRLLDIQKDGEGWKLQRVLVGRYNHKAGGWESFEKAKPNWLSGGKWMRYMHVGWEAQEPNEAGKTDEKEESAQDHQEVGDVKKVAGVSGEKGSAPTREGNSEVGAVRAYGSGRATEGGTGAEGKGGLLSDQTNSKKTANVPTGSVEEKKRVRRLDNAGEKALAGVPADEVPGTGGGREAGGGAVRRGGKDDGRVDRAGGERDGPAGRVGDGEGEVSVSAGGEPGVAPKAKRSAAQTAQERAENYTLSDADAIGAGGQKTKYKNNVAAIRLLKSLQDEGRQATRQEQAVLAKYVGWGGIPQAFARQDGGVTKGWEKQAAELRELLTEEEHAAARRSTQDAHYTSMPVVSAIWQGVSRLGFDGGLVLEPSVGVGNFFGLMPVEARGRSQLVGVELDPITGGIAKLLYPRARVLEATGFEDFQAPDNHFDLVVGNPPFGNQKLYDGKRKHLRKFSIHNYFFAKSLELTRPGGVMALVVSNYMMDANETAARAYLAERAELLGAVRLPNDAFKQTAGTEVTTDILFFRKLAEGEKAPAAPWVKTQMVPDPKGGEPVPLNAYFVAHPEQMLGEFGRYGTMYGPDMPALVARDGQDTPALLAERLAALPEGVMRGQVREPVPEVVEAAPQGVADVRVGSHFAKGGELYVREEDYLGEPQARKLELMRKSKGGLAPDRKGMQRVLGMIGVRDALADLRAAQLSEGADDGRLAALRKRLNGVYDAFVAQHGPVNGAANKRLFHEDPTWPQIAALEESYDKGVSRDMAKKTGEAQRKPSAKKAAIFHTRTQQPYAPVTEAATPKDALVASLAQMGRVNLGYMAELLGRPRAGLSDELAGLIYKNPEGGWETAEEYLSGNVKRKLALAREAAKEDAYFAQNVKALEAIQPADIEAVDIRVKPGAHWLPPEVVGAFADHLAEQSGARAVYAAGAAKWSVTLADRPATAAQERWGTSRTSLRDVLDAALNDRVITVRRSKEAGGGVNESATQAAADKVQAVRDEFSRWIWQDDARRDRLARLYNDAFNTEVRREFDGSHLTFPGKVSDDIIKLRPHQADAVWRIIQSPSTLLDHVVGAGKTFTKIAAIMEMRRLGLARKPMLVVPNHLVGQWAEDFLRLYPGANILAATKKDFEKDNRKRLFARMATGDWDAVIVAHSSFGRVGVEPAYQERFIQMQVDDLNNSIASLKNAGADKRTVKQEEKRKERLTNKLKSLYDQESKDDSLYFGELGVDALFVDEAHEFKNLEFSTSKQRVAGLGNAKGSQKAADLFMKVQQVQDKTGGRNVVFATGTPISNTMAEMFTMQRYLDYRNLKAQGLAHFDAWARMYGEEVSDWELSPSGQYKMNTRFAKFVNLPELMQGYLRFADVISRDDIRRQLEARGGRLPVPAVKGGKPNNVVVERSADQAMYIGVPVGQDEQGNDVYAQGSLIWRSEHIPKRPEKGADNMLKIMSDARKAALDMRLIDPSYGDYADSKVNRAAEEIDRLYRQWDADKGTQLVFIDLSTPKKAAAKERAALQALLKAADEGDEEAQAKLDKMSPDEFLALDSEFSVYDDLREKLIAKGIPAAEIAYIHDANTELQKDELFGKVRSGRVRVLLGSTPKMGAGMNVQDRLVALHHLDAPWRPSDLEQREGRIIRQGNKLYDRDPDGFEVEVLRYATKQTLDSRMWQTIEGKARFIEQARQGATGLREVDDVGGEAANAAEMKAASSGNPLILEEMSLRQSIRKLEGQLQEHDRSQYRLRARIRGNLNHIETLRDMNRRGAPDVEKARKAGKSFAMTLGGNAYDERKAAGAKILLQAAQMKKDTQAVGEFAGFRLELNRVVREGYEERNGQLVHVKGHGYLLSILGGREYQVDIDDPKQSDPVGLIKRIENTVRRIPDDAAKREAEIERLTAEIPNLEAQLQGWPKEDELLNARDRHREVIAQLKPKKAPAPDAAENAEEKAGDKPAFSFAAVLDSMGDLDGLAGDAAFFRSVSRPAMEREDVERIARRVFASLGMEGAAKLEIPSSVAQLPAAVRKEIGGEDSIKGLYWRGTVYVVANRVRSAEDIEALILEEAYGHHGIRELFGPEVVREVLKVHGAIGGDAGLMRLESEYGVDLSEYRRVAQSKAMKGVELNFMLTDELLAHMQAQGPKSLPEKVVRWLREVLGAVRAWLRDKGLAALARYNDADLAYLLRRMRRAAVRPDGAVKDGEPTYHRESAGQGGYADKVDQVLSGERELRLPIAMGRTPQVLRAIGLDDVPLVTTGAALDKAHYDHGITSGQLKGLPDLLADPVMIFESDTEVGAFVVVTDLHTPSGKPVVAVVHPNKKFGRIEVNFMPTAYPKDKPQQVATWVRGGLLRYQNKTKTPAWSTTAGVQFPGVVHSEQGSNKKILSEWDVFKGDAPSFSRIARKPGGQQDQITNYSITYNLEGIANTHEKQRDQALIDAREALEIPPSRAGKLAHAWEKSLSSLLGSLTLRQLADVGGKWLPQLHRLVQGMQQYQTSRNQMAERAKVLADRWQKLPLPKAKRLAEMMHKATLAGVDPAAEKYEPVVDIKEAVRRIAQINRMIAENPGDRGMRYSLWLKEKEQLQGKIRQERYRQKHRQEIEAMWKGLDSESRALFVEARDAYEAMHKRMEAAIIYRIEQAEMAEAARKAAILQVRQEFQQAREAGPYFPLQRFGKYYASAQRGTGEFYENKAGEMVERMERAFFLFESPAERAREMPDIKADGWAIIRQGVQKDMAEAMDQVSESFVAETVRALQEKMGPNQGDKAADVLYQSFLASMPYLSHRVHFIHRKKTPGFSSDALRAFAHNMAHQANQVARMEAQPDWEAALRDAEAHVKAAAQKAGDGDVTRQEQLLNEAHKRFEWLMNPQGERWASWATTTGFIWYLGLSPAAGLVNLSQTAIVSLPELAAKHGAAKSLKALNGAMLEVLAARRKWKDRGDYQQWARLSTDERRAFKQWHDSGVIDTTQTQMLMGLAETESAQYNPNVARALEITGAMFQEAEVINREATLLAAYRLARAAGDGHVEALRYAEEAAWNSHFDYSNANRARWMQSNWAKVLLLFRSYSQHMTYYLWRNAYQAWKGESAEVRAEARKKVVGVLGMTGVFAGAMGMPLLGLVFEIVNAAEAAFGDDDEPWDAETEFRAFLADYGLMGKVADRGLMNVLTGADWSSRTSLADLWIRTPDRDLEGKGLYAYYLAQLAGPLGGIGESLFRAADLAGEGHLDRAAETATPKFIKDPLRAIRYAMEGVTNYDGDPIVPEESLTALDVALRASGFSSDKVRAQWDTNRARKNYEKEVKDRRRALLRGMAMAIIESDAESERELLPKIMKFNARYPRDTINRQSIRASIRNYNRYRREAVGGVQLDRTLRPELEGVRVPM